MKRQLRNLDDWLFDQYIETGDYIEIIFNPQGKIIYINSILPNFNIKEVINSSIYDYLTKKSAEVTKESIKKAFKTSKKIIYETEMFLNENKNINFYYLNRLREKKIQDDQSVLHLIAIEITMYKILQKELLSMENKFKFNYSARLDGGFIYRIISPDLSIKYINEQYNKIFMSKTLPLNVLEQYEAEDSKKYKTHIEKIIKNKENREIEVREKRSDGSFVKCCWIDYPILGADGKVKEIHSYGIIKELTLNDDTLNKLQVYKELFLSGSIAFWQENLSELKKYINSFNKKQDLEIALNTSRKEILKCASLIKITGINTKTLSLFKIKSLEEINKKGIIPFFNNETILIFKERLIGLINGNVDFEAPCTSIDTEGNMIDFLLKVVIPEDYKNTLEKVFVFMINDSEKNKLRREIKAQYDQLIRADRLKSLGIMVAGAAHEINNPNHVVMLNSSMLKQFFSAIIDEINSSDLNRNRIMGMSIEELKQNIYELVKGIEESSGKIKYIVNELRNYTVKDCDSSKKIIDINRILKNAIRFTKSFIKNSTDKFEIIYSDKPILIYADQISLVQAFINIIENACQALKDKSEFIKIEVDKNKENDAVIKIVDAGIGIKEEDFRMLMTPFFTNKREKNGIGLGLFISHNIVENHNGYIDFKSESGKGTEVRITLPSIENN